MASLGAALAAVPKPKGNPDTGESPCRTSDTNPKEDTRCQIRQPHQHEVTEPQTRSRFAANATGAEPSQPPHARATQLPMCTCTHRRRTLLLTDNPPDTVVTQADSKGGL